MIKNLGFGNMRIGNSHEDLQRAQEAVRAYMEGEFCYFDLHPNYCNGKSQMIFKNMVADIYPRERYLVANKMPYYGINQYSDYTDFFQTQLLECGVEYFDYYMLHSLNLDNYRYHLKYGGFEFLSELKSKKLADKIGFSFHGTPQLLEEILSKYSWVDFVQLQINFCDWDSVTIQSKKLYEIASAYRKEIVVMEPVKGGTLAAGCTVSNNYYTPEMMADIALNFLLDLDNISVILSGMTNAKQVIANRNSVKRPRNYDIDYKKFICALDNNKIIPCTGCHYCERECPVGLKIPNIIDYINESLKSTETADTRIYFAELFYKSQVEKENFSSKCLHCGKCARNCPQFLPIPSFMDCATKIFESDNEKNIGMIKAYYWKHSYITSEKVIHSNKKYKIYCYGAGKCFNKNYETITGIGDIFGIIDSKSVVKDEIEILSLEKVIADEEAFIVITVEKINYAKEIMNTLKIHNFSRFDIYHNWIEYANNCQWY